MVTEFLNGGELFDRITEKLTFSEYEAARIIKQVLNVIKYCHAKNIVHRDLKPENLLLENQTADSNIKVIDFGTSTCFDPKKKLNETFGTVNFYNFLAVLHSSRSTLRKL